MVGKRTSGEELRAQGGRMPFGKLNPAVKMAISHEAIALQGTAHLLLTLLSHSPSKTKLAGIQWSGHSVGTYFWRGRKFAQRSGNRFSLLSTPSFKVSVFFHIATPDPVHGTQLLLQHCEEASAERILLWAVANDAQCQT